MESWKVFWFTNWYSLKWQDHLVYSDWEHFIFINFKTCFYKNLISYKFVFIIETWYYRNFICNNNYYTIFKNFAFLVCGLDLQTEFYFEFKEHTQVTIDGVQIPLKTWQTSFCTLNPSWVWKEKDHNIYYCKYPIELSYLKDAFNNLQRSHNFVLDKSCDCKEVTRRLVRISLESGKP